MKVHPLEHAELQVLLRLRTDIGDEARSSSAVFFIVAAASEALL